MYIYTYICIYIYKRSHDGNPSLCSLSHTENSHWISVVHIVHTFPCHSLHTTHPLHLTWSPGPQTNSALGPNLQFLWQQPFSPWAIDTSTATSRPRPAFHHAPSSPSSQWGAARAVETGDAQFHLRQEFTVVWGGELLVIFQK